jgi:hypothetical protein
MTTRPEIRDAHRGRPKGSKIRSVRETCRRLVSECPAHSRTTA